MELIAIKDAFDRVTKKQKLSSSKSLEVIEQLSRELEKSLSKLHSVDCSSSEYITLNELKTKFNEVAPLTQLEGAQKELNLALSKYQKLLEKTFNTEISKAYRNVDPDTPTLNEIITSHFCREGLFDIGDCFINEASEQKADSMRASFVKMHQILKEVKNRNLDPALSWAGANSEKLKQNGSDLELKLRRLQYVEIVQNKDERKEALEYAREFLSPFAYTHRNEVQKLMACLLWAGKLETSPYSEFLNGSNWDSLAKDFTQQYCNVLGQSYESPLKVAISAGFQGLPTLLKMMNVMIGRKNEWQKIKQLPVPMDLDKDFQFHSVFVCPVSRDQASDENPPMLLSCGHVLCKQSITKLSKNNSARPFKCPYCPTEVEVGKCRQLYL